MANPSNFRNPSDFGPLLLRFRPRARPSPTAPSRQTGTASPMSEARSSVERTRHRSGSLQSVRGRLRPRRGPWSGFVEPDSVHRLTEYAEVMVRLLGDRVGSWVTINEPLVYAAIGYLLGTFPPGQKLAVRSFFCVTHHLLKSHARMMEAGRAISPHSEFGIAESQIRVMPHREDNPRDAAAAARMDALINRLFIDPITHRTYPDALSRIARNRLPRGWEYDLETMHAPMDFVGINYTGKRYRHAPFRRFVTAKTVDDHTVGSSALWEVHPGGLGVLLRRLRDEYGNPKKQSLPRTDTLCPKSTGRSSRMTRESSICTTTLRRFIRRSRTEFDTKVTFSGLSWTISNGILDSACGDSFAQITRPKSERGEKAHIGIAI